MAIGTPTIVGSLGTASGSGTFAISSTTGAIATHDLVLVCHYCSATTGSSTGLADDSSNTYVKIISFFGSSPCMEIYACYDAIAMTTGHAITLTINGSGVRHGLYAINVTGMVNSAGVYDLHTGLAATVDRSTSTSSPSAAMLNAAANQMLLMQWTSAGATLGTYTANNSFTALTALTTNAFMYPAHKIISNGAAQNTAPSWVNSVSHITFSAGFVGIPATNTSRQAQMNLLGVGA